MRRAAALTGHGRVRSLATIGIVVLVGAFLLPRWPSAVADEVIAGQGSQIELGQKNTPCIDNTAGDLGQDTSAANATFDANSRTFTGVLNGDFFIGDTDWVRRVSGGTITTVLGTPGSVRGLPTDTPGGVEARKADVYVLGLAVDRQTLYVLDASPAVTPPNFTNEVRVLEVNLAASTPMVVLRATFPATNAVVRMGIAVDRGTLYIADPQGFSGGGGRIGSLAPGASQVTWLTSSNIGPSSIAVLPGGGQAFIAGLGDHVQLVTLQAPYPVLPIGPKLLTGSAQTLALDVASHALFVADGSGKSSNLYQVDISQPNAAPLQWEGVRPVSGMGYSASEKKLYVLDGVSCLLYKTSLPVPAQQPTTTAGPTTTLAKGGEGGSGSTTGGATAGNPSSAPSGSHTSLTVPVGNTSGGANTSGGESVQPGPAPGAANSGGESTGAGSSFLPSSQASNVVAPGAGANVNFTPPATPHQNILVAPDSGFLTAPGASGTPGAVSPPLGPPAPLPAPAPGPAPTPGPVGQFGGVPPPPGGGPLNPSPGLGVAPGQPAYPATRYAMVRSTGGGLNPVPIGLFGLGGCMVLFAVGLGLTTSRGGPERAPAPAKAWAVGR